MFDIGKRFDGQFNVWRMKHDGRHFVVAVCKTEEEATEYVQKSTIYPPRV